jgi:hypothetical protein
LDNFGAWLLADTGADGDRLREFIKKRQDWPQSDDLNSCLKFVEENVQSDEAGKAKKLLLLEELTKNYTRWKQAKFSFKDYVINNIGYFGLFGFGSILAIVFIYGIFSHDSSFLDRVKDPDAARGLLTFLFGFTTISLFILIAITTFWMNDFKERFDKAKDLLMVMIGIFGTIIGFYYGSLGNRSGVQALSLVNATDVSTGIKPGDSFTIIATATGGKAPLKYDIVLSDPKGSPQIAELSLKNQPVKDGVIRQPITIPVGPSGPVNYTVTAIDADGAQLQSVGTVLINK